MSQSFFLLAPYITKKAHDGYRGQKYKKQKVATGCTTGCKLSVFLILLY